MCHATAKKNKMEEGEKEKGKGEMGEERQR